MQQKTLRQRISLVYLILVPFLTALLGFGVGHISYTIYLPVWMVHACLMIIAIGTLFTSISKAQGIGKRQVAIAALLLIAPWIFISMFFGMGAPPATIAGWVERATEQQVRYAILIGCGILFTSGFILLREQLKKAGESLFSTLGFGAMLMAAPLFIINMAFWGSFLTESFKGFVTVVSTKKPEWYRALQELFFTISVVEVELIYLATVAFAASLKKTGWFRPGVCNIYMGIGWLCFLLNLIPPSWPDPFSTVSYIVAVPAIHFIMPYLMGVNLLKKQLQTPFLEEH